MKTTESLKNKAYNAIINDIFSNVYIPNQILNEKDLVSKYGFSKTPIREALHTLCNDNILRNIPRCGYEVIRVTMDDVHELLQFRYVLEAGLLSVYYDSFSERQISRLAALNEQCTQCSNDLWQHWTSNCDFHIMMLSFCHNTYAVKALKQCMERLKIAYAQFYRDDLDSTFFLVDTLNHQQIIESLKEKNLEQLLLFLKEDVYDFGAIKFSPGR